MGVHWVELPFEEGGLLKPVEQGHMARCGGWGTWYEQQVSWGQSPADGGPSRRCGSAQGVQNEVVVGAMGENNSGGDCHCSRGFVWWSWELRGRVVTGNGGVDGGGG